MTSPAGYLAALRARQAEINRERVKHPMKDQRPYQEREAEIMRSEAAAEAEVRGK